ncbi:hypothetical protein PUNSTDRAFT_142257, partial [Punctularia strigosozonata HHB-11173 SS5]|uniref:uncharacterized protein n=1 Tax=Punctularia strigosozonata (strain HHB-11173) TaxID=741275 RepID=UPI0004417F41
MAAKTSLANPDHAATTLLAQLPASLAPSSPLLAASLPLLPNPLVSYSVYAPASAASDVLHTLDDARRRILAFPIVQHGPDRLAPPPLRDALLPYTHVALGLLYVFALGTTDGPTPSTTALASLSASLPPSLVLRDTGTFTPQDLYPCSPACAPQRMPCPACLNPPLAHALPRYPSPPASPSRPRRAGSGPRLPREPLRLPYALFLDALRARLLDDVVRVSACSTDPSEPPVKRLGAGFLLGPSPATSRWSDGWQHHAQSRPLIYCHLHLHLHATHISIHPLLRPTPYLPLPLFLSPSPPSTSHGRPASLRPGAPIVLLPFHTPAHFLAPYPASSSPSPSSSQTSPSASALSSLTRQFTASLAGLGAGDWTSPPPYLSPPTRTSPFSASASASHPDPSSVPTSDTHTDRDRDRDRDRDKDKHATPTYIIAWLPLDPDRGLPIVWPARLSLAFSPSSPITSSSPSSSTPPPPPPLSHIPALAPQLQPSPPPPAPSLPLPLSLAHLARLSSASASAPSSAAPSPTTAGAAAGPIASLVARSLSRSTTPGPGPGPSSATALGPVPGGGGGVGAGTGGGGVGVGAGTGVGGGAGGGPGSRPPSRGPFAYHPPASPTRAAAAFRALTLAQDAPPGRSRTTRERRERTATRTRGGSGIRARAVEVAVYTDAVAKERERERERMRREREREREREGGAGSSKAEADKEEDVGAVGVGSSSSPPPLALAQPIGVGVGEGRGAAMDGAGGGFAEGGGGGQVREGGGEQAAVQDAGMAPPSTADVPPVPDSIGAPAAPPAPAPTSYDFALEGWGSAAGDDYMDFDFAMDMDAIASGGAPHDIPTVAANMDVDMGVGVDFEEMFTEDDFSFFDKPSTAAAAATSTTTSAVTALAAPLTASTTLAEHGLPIFGSGLTPAAGPAPLGLSPPFADPPWPAPTPADAFEPPAPPPPPELVPPSSRDTPSSAASPAPATPAVHVAASPGGGASPFDPIPFAPTHRQADGKYLLGKFALPVLGKEPVLGEEDVVLPLSPKSAAAEGWRLRYAAATDPRVGVIKQLIGVKRKAQGARAADKASPSWLRNDEEWLDSTAYGDEDARDDEADAGSSTSGSSSDSDSPEEDAGAGEDERI